MIRPQGENDLTSDWLAFYRSSPQARLRLFCLPSAGAGATIYRNWRGYLPETIDICPVQPPGRENRIQEPAFTSASDLVTALDQALEPALDRPYILLGHSLGATLAYEWAQRIRRRAARGPLSLIVIARAAPQIPVLSPPVHRLPASQLKTHLRSLGGTAEVVLENDELMEILLPLLRADFEVNDTYRHDDQLPLDCPIAVFGGLDDSVISKAALEAWRDMTTSQFTLQMLPGNHFELLRSPELIRAVSALVIGRIHSG